MVSHGLVEFHQGNEAFRNKLLLLLHAMVKERADGRLTCRREFEITLSQVDRKISDA